MSLASRDPIAPRAPAASHPRAALLVALLTIVATAVWVYHGALAYFFAQDDFAGLARGRGLAPALATPWRYLSGQVYFTVMAKIAGLDPHPYRAFSLAAHAACGALVFRFLRARVSGVAAWLAALFFVAHPASFTALYSVSGVGEILALLFALLALIAFEARGPKRWWAVPCFALALLAKETTILLPLVAWLAAGSRPRAEEAPPAPRRAVDPLVIALVAIAVLHASALLATNAFSVRGAIAADSPYAYRFDGTLARNLLTYLGWIADFGVLTVRSFTDAIEPAMFPIGIAALALWAAGLAARPLRARGWLAAGVLAFAWLLPVLPLPHHTYHYYLYAPLVGAAWCVGALADVIGLAAGPRRVAGARGRGARADPAAAGGGVRRAILVALASATGALLALNGALLVRSIETHPFVHPALRSDPTVDRARIAANVIHDLGQAALPPGARIRLWSPTAIAAAGGLDGGGALETYFESNVREALLSGLAVRIFFPQIGGVEFVRAFAPSDSTVRYAVYRIDGHLRVADSATLEAAIAGMGRPR